MAIEEINQLQKLDFTKQLVFAYLTCERLYPNYVYFFDNFHFGDPEILREAIDFLYISIFETRPDKNKIDSLIKKVNKITPDPGEFDTGLASSALDACTAVSDSLDFLIDKEFSRIKDISTFGTDTVDMYIQGLEPDLDFNKDRIGFRQRIDNHPLMKKEIAIQTGIIAFLTKSKGIDVDDLKPLFQLQENNGKGNIGL